MGKKLKSVLFIILPILWSHFSFATHLKAGEITSQRISSFQYRFTLTIFLDSLSVANSSGLSEPKATLNFGDGTTLEVDRAYQVSVGNSTLKNGYTFVHTFPGSGSFTVSYQIDNRNAGILNINGGQSGELGFYIESKVVINPFLGANNSPIMLYSPIDEGTVGQVFKHNPGAYDPEGDSISYSLGVPRRFQGVEVPNFVNPNAINNTIIGTYSLDPVTGDLIWDAPSKVGLYNIVIIITEWRNGQIIGSIVRDMQVRITQSTNKSPIVKIPKDTCVVAGSKLTVEITATDPDGDRVNMTATGGPLTSTNPKATFIATQGQPTKPFPATGIFSWNLTCDLVRDQPYQVLFRVEDLQPEDRQLFDLESWNIKVVGIQPQGLVVSPTPMGFQLNWNPYTLCKASKMLIYRKDCDSSKFVPDPCGGLSEGSGFKKIGEVPIAKTSFLDTTFIPGSFSCYVIVAQFPDPKGGLSLVSDQSCVVANEGEPLPLNSSIITTDVLKGKVLLRWTQPLELDKTLFSGPYQYVISRSIGINGTNFIPIDTFYSLEDTLMVDSLVQNTLELGHNYKVSFYYTKNGKFTLKSDSETFSTVFLKASPGNTIANLTWAYSVPWVNSDHFHRIYQELSPENFKLIDSVAVIGDVGKFTVSDLANGDTVCFYIETQGEYCRAGLPNPLLNKSQRVCVVPHDTIAPCPPFLNGPTACIEEGITNLTVFWKPNFSVGCNKEIKDYTIYYKEHEDDEFIVLEKNVPDTFFVDTDNFSLAGCYAVTANDFYGVESAKSNSVCIDICVFYELPNLITPNDDKHNDYFRPFPVPKNVKQVNFSVYNRWGSKIFFTNSDVNINWPGVDQSGESVSSGIYFYEAEVIFKRRLRKTDEIKIIKGWVHVIHYDNGGNRDE